MPVPAERKSGFSCFAVSDGGTAGSCVQLQDVVWNLGQLAAGASRTVHFSVELASTLTNGTVIALTARVRDATGATARAATTTVTNTGA